MAKENQDNDRQAQIMTASLRKSLNIAYFNATNSAIALVSQGMKDHPELFTSSTILQNAIGIWRDWFIEQYKEYHLTVIEPITPEGVTADAVILRVSQISDLATLRAYYSTLPGTITNDKRVLEFAKAHALVLKNAIDQAQKDADLPTVDISAPVTKPRAKKKTVIAKDGATEPVQ